MTTSPIAPPDDVVTVLPEGRTVFGMQLPIQSQSTIYVQPWEVAAGPEELAAVALAWAAVIVCEVEPLRALEARSGWPAP